MDLLAWACRPAIVAAPNPDQNLQLKIMHILILYVLNQWLCVCASNTTSNAYGCCALIAIISRVKSVYQNIRTCITQKIRPIKIEFCNSLTPIIWILTTQSIYRISSKIQHENNNIARVCWIFRGSIRVHILVPFIAYIRDDHCWKLGTIINHSVKGAE